MLLEEIQQEIIKKYKFKDFIMQCPNKFIYWRPAYFEHERLGNECECKGKGIIPQPRIEYWMSGILNHKEELNLNNDQIKELLYILKNDFEIEFFKELWQLLKEGVNNDIY